MIELIVKLIDVLFDIGIVIWLFTLTRLVRNNTKTANGFIDDTCTVLIAVCDKIGLKLNVRKP